MRPLLVPLVAALLVLTGCSAPETSLSSSSPSTSSSAPPESPPPSAPESSEEEGPPPAPVVGECHRLTWDKAIAPVVEAPTVPCRRTHTSQTYAVGRLSLASDDERLSVDDPTVQDKPAEACPLRLPAHLGVSPRELRLTMARPVWFTPTLEEADAGANWFRCDVVVLATTERLLRLPPRTKGRGAADDFAMCASGRPGTPAFSRVACVDDHSWRAVTTVDLAGGKRLPSVKALTSQMTSTCRDTARSRADDPLDLTWSEELPTKEQWRAGRRYGICWVPD